MADYTTISADEQENILASFWQMLAECEQRAAESKDPVLTNWVEQWYQQWNRTTGDSKKPHWLR